MSEPFLAEIMMVGFNFPPRGWAFCDGQILPINQNQSLFSLLGTTYGGDGRTSFALPDLRGRTPTHVGDGLNLGMKTGEEHHALQTSEMPIHTHTAQGSSENADAPVPNGFIPAAANNVYAGPANLVGIHPQTIPNVGGQSHENMQPYLVIGFCIALQGLFPSRN